MKLFGIQEASNYKEGVVDVRSNLVGLRKAFLVHEVLESLGVEVRQTAVEVILIFESLRINEGSQRVEVLNEVFPHVSDD